MAHVTQIFLLHPTNPIVRRAHKQIGQKAPDTPVTHKKGSYTLTDTSFPEQDVRIISIAGLLPSRIAKKVHIICFGNRPHTHVWECVWELVQAVTIDEADERVCSSTKSITRASSGVYEYRYTPMMSQGTPIQARLTYALRDETRVITVRC